MDLGTLFWVIVVVSLIFGGINWSPQAPAWCRPVWGWVQIVLICMIGWRVFGPVIK